ncbi:MAG: hypothetical protein Q9227_000318 [Pyrenula ochraceoflavens]
MSTKYAAQHPEPSNGPGDGRPTALQIVADNNLTNALTDKVILITGTSSGIGVETVRALATTGATIYCTARSLPKARTVLGPSLLSSPRIHLLEMDNTSLTSVRAAASTLLSSSRTLNILICNAGVMATPQSPTPEGNLDLQLTTHHLSHFLLFSLLRPALQSSSTPTFASRVVCVSSSAHRVSGINFSDLNYETPGSYNPHKAYGQSKTANIYMASEIERRFASSSSSPNNDNNDNATGAIHAFSLHPGGIWSGLQQHIPSAMMNAWKGKPEVENHMKSAEQGAATTVWAAIDKSWEGQRAGVYLEDCQVAREVGKEDMRKGDPLAKGYAEWAYDGEKAGRLWEVSEELVGV